MSEHSTKPEVSAVNEYLKSIGQYELLTAEQEVELAQRMERGLKAESKLEQLAGEGQENEKRYLGSLVIDGQEAKSEFINSNLRLVVSIAKRYQNSGLELLDIIQEGNLGLIRAIEKFDYRKGFKFSTYATWWIRQAISRGLAEKSRTIRVPTNMHDLILTVHKAEGELTTFSGMGPTDEEIAEITGLSVDKTKEARKYGREIVSLHVEVGDGGALLEEFIADDRQDVESEVMAGAEVQKLAISLSQLDEQERTVIIKRYGLDGDKPSSYKAIGLMLGGFNHAKVRQIELSALAKLRSQEETQDSRKQA